jgi:Cellulase (glycosyl hydrolase family 5)
LIARTLRAGRANAIFLLFLTFSAGATSFLISDVQSSTTNEPFVCTTNGSLAIGQDPVKMIGANSYGILGGYLGIGNVTGTLASEKRLSDAAACGLHLVRFWLDVAPSDYWFQLAYSKFTQDKDHHVYFIALDKFVADARANKIRLIPVLSSAFDQWTRIGNRDDFWQVGSRSNLAFKQWTMAIVSRYANSSTVAWWEVANEPNYFAKVGVSRADTPTLVTWGQNIYNTVKSIDPNHLISGGFSNTGNLDLNEFGQLNKPFDIASIHIYERDLYNLELQRLVFNREDAIRDFVQLYSDYSRNVLHKPLVFGEFNGDKLTPSPWFVERFLHYALSNADAALIWSWEEGKPSDPYLVSPDNTPQVVKILQQYSSTISRTS